MTPVPLNPTDHAYRRPRLGLGSAAIDAAEEEAALAVLRSGNLFRYYGDDPRPDVGFRCARYATEAQ